MPATIKTPTYRGFVSDGWGIDARGRMFHQPDRHRVVRELETADLSDEVDMLIDAGLIGLSAERPEQLAAGRALLSRIPAAIRRAIFRRGRLRIVAGDHVANAHGQQYAGLTNYLTAAVAGDNQDAESTFLHELGHMLDNVSGWQSISNSEAWLAIWRAGRVPSFAGQDREPAEYFAESFARHFSGDSTLSAAVRLFMETMAGQFA